MLGSIKGVKMNVVGPAFTHVMYADDIMIFAKANCNEICVLDNCLETYCEWLGQLINRDKSGLICSKLVQHDRKREIKHILEMKKVNPHASYLGSPLFHSNSRIKDFKFLQDKLEARLMGWRSKALSWAGRATMIRPLHCPCRHTPSHLRMFPFQSVRKWMLPFVNSGGNQIKNLVVTLRGEPRIIFALLNLWEV